jgi:hypothetical protein
MYRKNIKKILAFILVLTIILGDFGGYNIAEVLEGYSPEVYASINDEELEESAEKVSQILETEEQLVWETQLLAGEDQPEGLERMDNAHDSELESEAQEETNTEEVEEQPVVYWNPEAENQTMEGSYNESGDLDGQSAENPITTMEGMLQKTRELQENLDQEITVYVMSPYEIEEGENKEFDGEGARFIPWDGRNDEEDFLFSIKGGSLALSHVTLASGSKDEQANVISVEKGNLHLGEQITLQGTILMDYTVENEGEGPSLQADEKALHGETYGVEMVLTDEQEGSKVIEAQSTADISETLLNSFHIVGEADVEWNLEKGEDANTLILSRVATIGSNIVYWNIEGNTTYDEEGRPLIIGGNDEFAGTSEMAPVQSWNMVKELLGPNGGTVYVMNSAVAGSDEFPLNELDGENKIALTQWSGNPGDIFLIPPNKTLKLKNVSLMSYSENTNSNNNIILRITESGENDSNGNLGRLIIGDEVLISGLIQTELNQYDAAKLQAPTVKLETSGVPSNKYTVYYSNINDNIVFRYKDVIEVPDGQDADAYLSCFVLSELNANAGWGLRKDSGDGESPIKLSNIELYNEFVYEGIYVNGQSGNDEWFGGNDNRPVRTFQRAKELLMEHWDEMQPEHRIIYICDTVDIGLEENANQSWSLEGLEGAKVMACSGNDSYHNFHTKPPEVMIKVHEGASFITKDIIIEYSAAKNKSIMVAVEPGGSYILQSGTELGSGAFSSYSGTGVAVKGAPGKMTKLQMEEGAIISGRARGVSVIGGDENTEFIITGGTITENWQTNEYYYGAGVYIEDAYFTMSGGTISFNRAAGSQSSDGSVGSGVYVKGENSVFNMSGGIITQNIMVSSLTNTETRQGQGGGVHIENSTFNLSGTAQIVKNENRSNGAVRGVGVSLNMDSKMVMTGGVIAENNSINQNSNYKDYGIGLYANQAEVVIDGGEIRDNTGVTAYGAGIGIAGTSSKGHLSIKNAVITGNQTGLLGGGIYSSKSFVEIESSKIQNNSSKSGGGIYLSNYVNVNRPVTISGTNISGNIAEMNGGGIVNTDSNSLLLDIDTVIENNIANAGGGIYAGKGFLSLYNKVLIKGNVSLDKGGGIYTIGDTYIDDAELISNEAANAGGGIYNSQTLYIRNGILRDNKAVEGGNLYLDAGECALLGGIYENTIDEEYGIYLNRPQNSSNGFFLDSESCVINDKVYLSNSNNPIYLLNKLTEPIASAKLPLYLNKETFGVGNVVVHPAGNKTFTINDSRTSNYIYNETTDVESYSDYFSGGVLPDKTQLGGYEKKVMLVGEGVYLDGKKGSDDNSGSSPSTAVKTFAKAKEILGSKIGSAKIAGALPVSDPGYDSDGFEPYIYICGEVEISGSTQENPEVWSLDALDTNYSQKELNSEGNIINEEDPKVIRFASYTGTLIRIGNESYYGTPPGYLLLDKIVIDGNVKSVTTSTGSMIVLYKDSHMIVQDSVIENNYGSGIYSNEGSATIKGSDNSKGSILRNFSGSAIEMKNSGDIRLESHSQIINSSYYDDNIELGAIPGVRSLSGGVTIEDTSSTGMGSIILADSSSITANQRYGICSWGRSNDSKEPIVLITDNAVINSCSTGIFMNYSSSVVKLDKNARIENFTSIGIRAQYVTRDSRIELTDSARIVGKEQVGDGIYVTVDTTSVQTNLTINIDGNAVIENTNHGIGYSLYSKNVVTNISGEAEISRNKTGIEVNTNNNGQGYPSSNVINIFGKAKIDANDTSGIHNKIGHAVYNIGEDASVSNNVEHGLYFTSTSASMEYSGSEATIGGNAKIEGNGKDGISVKDINITTYHKVKLTIKDSAFIGNNKLRGINGGYETDIILEGNVLISGNQSIEAGNSIYTGGKLRMDGTVRVTVADEDEIFLYNSKNAITLTSPAVEIYKIGVTEKYIGQVLVQPVGTALVPTMDAYVSNFIKTNNFPEGRDICLESPNLIVGGDNNVYLSGSGYITMDQEPGNDENNGLGPGAPVATFERALEVLKTLDPGADIVICNYTVDFGRSSSAMPDGDTWSFGVDGEFVGDKGTWKPKVVRYEKFQDIMIGLYTSRLSNVTFNNITFDGNKEAFPVGIYADNSKSSSAIMYVDTLSGTLNLNNCTVQNNKVSSNIKRMVGMGIFNQGNINIFNSTITGNECYGKYNSSGGGIYNTGILVIKNSEISNNVLNSSLGDTASTLGGGIYSIGYTSEVTIESSKIIGNILRGRAASGSALALYSGTDTISNSQIKENLIDQSMDGNIPMGHGTVYSEADLTITNTHISKNMIVGSTISSSYDAKGGGIYQKTGSITASGLTLEENILKEGNEESLSGATKGGGLYLTGGTFKFLSGTVQGNAASEGAAVYLNGFAELHVSGGNFQNNKPRNPDILAQDANAGIYVKSNFFYLQGGGAKIDDRIYLSSVNYSLNLSGAIYQKNRLYQIDLSSKFGKGSVVVKPDNNVIIQTSPYLRFFVADKGGYVLEKEGVNLVLKHGIYVDGVLGNDTNSGSTPGTAVKTMEKAISLGGLGNYVIYVCGPVEITDTQKWIIPSTAWISRYTGFKLAKASEMWPAYTGDLVVVSGTGNLDISDVRMTGRRDIDNTVEGGSLLRVESGAALITGTDTQLNLNTRIRGEYGGAIYIDGGMLDWQGGTISNMEASEGSAIYQNGIMKISGTDSSISGEIYLAGTGVEDETSKTILADSGYRPLEGMNLKINIENVYKGRPVIEYPDGYMPTETQQNYYVLDPTITTIYYLNKRVVAGNILELNKRDIVYVDGIAGDDNNTGATPVQAVKTFAEAFYKLEVEGGVIIVVNTVTIDSDVSMGNNTTITGINGYYQGDGREVTTNGAVSIQRYSRPAGWESFINKEEYERETHLGNVIYVTPEGVLSTEGITIDGHSIAVRGEIEVAAPPVESLLPLINVEGVYNANIDTSITYNNNVSEGAKGSGIYIAESGLVNGVSVIMTKLYSPNAGKGSAIFNSGRLILDVKPKIEGSIHLTGNGESDISSSRFIEITRQGFAPKTNIEITMDDPYLGRSVIKYPGTVGETPMYVPTLEDIDTYLLEDYVTEIYSLQSRSTDKNILELANPKRVYVDGVNGSDTQSGKTPAQSVKTLKKAYEILQPLGGGTIYIVDTVSIQGMEIIKSNLYESEDNMIHIIGGKVQISRYVLPDAKASDPEYNNPGTNQNILLEVLTGGILEIENLTIDGHSESVDRGVEEVDVAEGTKVFAPLIQTREGSYLNLYTGAELRNNNNILGHSVTIEGGAINNKGIVNFDEAKLLNNNSLKGSGIYQAGDFHIMDNGTGIGSHEIYLASQQISGEEWVDKIIHINSKLKEDLKFQINADHAVQGRNIAQYDSIEAYGLHLDDEYVHYSLGDTITSVVPSLYLVESQDLMESEILELNNYEILDISVPAEMFLTVHASPGIIEGNLNVRNAQLESPDYTITNLGNYETKISVIDFINDNDNEGITFDKMILVENPSLLTAPDLDKKLYLAIDKANINIDNKFKDLEETPLANISLNADPVVFGTLEPNTSGEFTFKGEARDEFFDKYNDETYGLGISDLNAYVKDNARAKYQLIYKFELIR